MPCVPSWNTRPVLRAVWASSLITSNCRQCVTGFSQYTSLPALIAAIDCMP